jgi:hypothetical protein
MSYMFDQPSYDQPSYGNMPAAADPLPSGELFRNYEIKSWVLSPRLYKILAISAFFNIAVVVFAAQTSLLTRKGCESPLVGSVCQVLDTVYVGSVLFGTKREYVDAVYDKTELGEDDDITFVDVSKDTPPLTYPAGYFQIANPEQDLAMLGDVDDLGGDFTTGNIPGIPPGLPLSHPGTGNSLFDTPQNLPPSNPNVVQGPLPGMNDHGSYNPPIAKRRKGLGGRISPPHPRGPSGTPGPSPEDTTADNKNPKKDPNGEKKVDPTEPVTDAEINKQPFVLLAGYINNLLDKNEVKLDSPFLISATGKLDKNGKLDPKSFKYVKAESTDAKMLEVVKEAIEAMNDSGYLQYLKDLSGKDLTIQILQDDTNVKALIQSQMESDTRAQTISSGLNFIINYKKQAKEAPTADDNDKDDLVLLQNAAVTSQGKALMIGFNIPKADLLRMIQRKLADQKTQPKQPEGTEPAKPSNTAG